MLWELCVMCPLLLPLEGELSREGAAQFKLREHYPHVSHSPETPAMLLAAIVFPLPTPVLTLFKLKGGTEPLMHHSEAGRGTSTTVLLFWVWSLCSTCSTCSLLNSVWMELHFTGMPISVLRHSFCPCP